MTYKLLCVFPHPDDESLGCGPTLAKYAAEGVGTHLLCATRGERGWNGPPEDDPGLAALGRLREAELAAAAKVLGLREVTFLDYIDGEVDQAVPAVIIRQIVEHIRRVRPHVVVTFGPDGAYGHPDHIALSQFTSAALVCAADAGYVTVSAPHRVSKFYYMVDFKGFVEEIERLIGKITMEVDGVVRAQVGWEDWAVTTRLDTRAHWRTALQAALCHASQVGPLRLTELSDEMHQRLWGEGNFYRAFSLVNGGRKVESDLFEGLKRNDE